MSDTAAPVPDDLATRYKVLKKWQADWNPSVQSPSRMPLDEEVVMIERIAQLEATIRKKDEQLKMLEQRAVSAEIKADTEASIINRIWKMFGNPSYESLEGKSIYDLIADVQARAALAQKEQEAIRAFARSRPQSYISGT